MNIKKFPVLSTGFGLKLMAENGEIFSRVNNDEENSDNDNLLVYGTNIDTVICIKNGKPQLMPVFVPNSIFTDAEGRSFIQTKEKDEAEVALKAAEAGCGYIVARKQVDGSFKAEAYFAGLLIDFPQTLWNEMGVSYKFVDYAKYGEICKRVHGYYLAKKVEPIYVLDAQVGDCVRSVINGVKEHEAVVSEGETVVQNAYHGETYKMKLKKLKKLYFYAETTPEGYQLWKPKEEIQTWTFTTENIFGVLWEGFEFLAKAMININDPSDVYGCNYTVFNGDDTAKGSHQKLKLFLPANPLPESWLQTPEVLEGQHLTLEAVPKTEYIECPFPLILWQKLA